MSKFTSGPWTVIDEDDGETLQVRGQNDEFVADCNDGFHSDDHDGQWQQAAESLPNARLIAAAPELLEIARLLSILTEEGDDRLYGAYVRDDVIRAKGSTLDLIEKARAAIAKAEAA